MRRPLYLSLIIILLTVANACWSSPTANSTNEVSAPFKSSDSNSPFKPSTPVPTALPIPTPLNRPGDEARVHVNNVKKFPVARRPEDFYELDDAISSNDDAKALKIIQSGKVSMVMNDSLVTVIEPTLYLTKIKVKQGGVVGWVKSA